MAIDYTVSDEGVAVITINRPERLNAMDAEHYKLLSQAWCTVRDDPAVRVAIVTGAGERAFTTGADRPLLLDKAMAALLHAKWDVRVAAARLLSVAGGKESLAPLQDAVARETTDGVAHELLQEAVETLARRA